MGNESSIRSDINNVKSEVLTVDNLSFNQDRLM